MKKISCRKLAVTILLSAVFVVFSMGCGDENTTALDHDYQKPDLSFDEGASGIFKSNEIAVESPPFTDGIFPCNDCHSDIEPNPVRRQLIDMHDDIEEMFDHDSDNRWCLDCHDMNNRDYLKLASGKLIGFDESYQLCGQCHGDKLRDWKVGIHGKRTGEWNGKKHYLLCVHCHNPHSPKFPSLRPLPPPVRQEDIH